MPNFRTASLLISSFVALLSVTGCDAVKQAGDSVKNQVSRDTWHPDKATNEKVAIHVYLDRSGSSIPVRDQMSQELVDLLDIYPQAVTTTIYWYSDKTSKIKDIYSSRAEAQVVADEFVTDKHESPADKTYLSRAMDDLTKECDRNPDMTNIGIFVTNGGFDEDPTVVKNSVIQLARRKNSDTVMFLGLTSDGTDRISRLDTFVRDPYMSAQNKHYFDIALQHNDAMLNSAKKSILTTIQNSESGVRA